MIPKKFAALAALSFSPLIASSANLLELKCQESKKKQLIQKLKTDFSTPPKPGEKQAAAQCSQEVESAFDLCEITVQKLLATQNAAGATKQAGRNQEFNEQNANTTQTSALSREEAAANQACAESFNSLPSSCQGVKPISEVSSYASKVGGECRKGAAAANQNANQFDQVGRADDAVSSSSTGAPPAGAPPAAPPTAASSAGYQSSAASAMSQPYSAASNEVDVDPDDLSPFDMSRIDPDNVAAANGLFSSSSQSSSAASNNSPNLMTQTIPNETPIAELSSSSSNSSTPFKNGGGFAVGAAAAQSGAKAGGSDSEAGSAAPKGGAPAAEGMPSADAAAYAGGSDSAPGSSYNKIPNSGSGGYAVADNSKTKNKNGVATTIGSVEETSKSITVVPRSVPSNYGSGDLKLGLSKKKSRSPALVSQNGDEPAKSSNPMAKLISLLALALTASGYAYKKYYV